MGRLSLTAGMHPATLARTLARRGLAGAAWRAARRLGAVGGAALVGPEVVQITPVTATCNHACPMCWLQHTGPSSLQTLRPRETQARLSLAEWEHVS